jgi:hypothetical protein
MRSTSSAAQRRTALAHRLPLCALAALTLALAGQPLRAASVQKTNLVDLVGNADTIVAGRVESVSDGFDAHGVPYTEVTLKVAKKIRGREVHEAFSFRQFGLLEPKTLPSGKVALTTVPDGWSRYHVGEDVALFLYAPARLTGLRTTVGLEQGKLAVVNGSILRTESNGSLFDDVVFENGLLNASERAFVARGRAKKDLEVDQFLGLVRRAVDEDWVGQRRMRHAR